MDILLLVPAAFFLTALLWADDKDNFIVRLVSKTLLSCVFVAVAWLQPGSGAVYYLILSGLILGLVGDVCLALNGAKPFIAGLAAFLLGHVSYLVAFIFLSKLGAWFDPTGLIVLVVAAGGLLFWFLPKAGEMRIPVAAYIAVIIVMIDGAWAVWNSGQVPPKAASMLLTGAVLFALSDFFVARQRFDRQEFYNRAIGLPLYYTAQFLIAFALGMLAAPTA